MNLKKINISDNTVFYFFILISIIPLFFYKFYISLDGPQHLYTSNIIVQLLKGNDFISSYFSFNKIIVGYWSGHALLSVYNFFLPALYAEKLYILTYILGMAFSYRFLIRSFDSSRKYMVVLIFPFIFSMYFLMGYYTFSFAFIPYFLLFGYLKRKYEQLTFKNIFILTVLFLFSYFSHAYVFALTLISLFVYFFLNIAFKYFKNGKIEISRFVKKALILFISVIPSLVLTVLYFSALMQIDNTVTPVNYSTKELIVFILRIRQLVGFHHDIESRGNILIFVVLMFLIISLIIKTFGYKKEKLRQLLFCDKNIWFIIAFVFLCLYFFLPDRISAGSLTNRVGLFFFVNLIIGLSVQNYKKIIVIISTVLLIAAFIFLQNYRTKEYRSLNGIVEDIRTVEEYIDDNSILLPIKDTDFWFDRHFSCYLGIDKPIVNLRSPQNTGKFPVIWNFENLPIIRFGDQLIKKTPPKFLKGSENMRIDSVDYVLFYHKEESEISGDKSKVINAYYNLIYTSPKGYAELYKLK